PLTQEHGVGTLLMFAVRNIFSRPGQLAATMRNLAAAGEVPRWLAETEDPLGFLIHEGGAHSVIDAAYRFVRHEPGVDVVLFGTGEAEHMRTNIASLLAPPLPETGLSPPRGPFRPSGRRRVGRAASSAPGRRLTSRIAQEGSWSMPY